MKIFIRFLICLLLLSANAFAHNITDEMIGQMILTGFKGNSVNSRQYKTILKQLKKGEIGGVIFFKHNIKNPQELFKMTEGIKNANKALIPLVSIDQEGGIIQIMNANNGFENYMSQKNTADEKTLQQAEIMYLEMAKALNMYNFNLNYAPCVDVILDENSIINKKERSFSANPQTVIKYAKAVLRAYFKHNIITSLKHFPGHGSFSDDTHLGFADATNTWNREKELLPYKELINSNELQTVMVSHIFIKQLDDKYPASLSYNIVQGLLRDELKFNGVVITDDLEMGAIKNNYKLKETVINAVNAGDNILMFANFDRSSMRTAKKVKNIIKRAIKKGEIKPETVEIAYQRIVKLKKSLEDKTKEKQTYDAIIKKYQGKVPKYWGENAKGVIRRIKTNDKIIAITLDACGSKNDSFDKDLIDFLIKENVPATLFINSRWIDKNPKIFKELSQNPLFEIENHGLLHKPASINGKSIYNIEGTKNVEELIEEVDFNGKKIEELTGIKPIYFRSGTAFYDEWAVKAIEDLGYRPVGFSILGDRGATYSAKQVRKAVSKANKGDIAIFHMNHPEKETAEGLIPAIQDLKKRGFKFVLLKDYEDLLY